MPSLDDAVGVLGALAPLELAADWDNVGLLVEGRRPIERIGLTVDLTEPVLAELLDQEVDLIVSYHPPIFGGVKRITASTPGGRVLLELIRAGVHVYSPHTALDAVEGGMNDWLVEGLGPVEEMAPIDPVADRPAAGMGRIGSLATPTPVNELVERLKAHLGLRRLRLAAPDQVPLIRRVAVCPGAGGSLFQGVGPVDLLLTGEMRHHDVLARVANGSVVVLTDHTNTERGYLGRLARMLEERLGVVVHVSRVDQDPLRIV